MTVVVDTNVLVSGIFFTGPPHDILRGWIYGSIDLVVSPEILEEYRLVIEKLAGRFTEVDTLRLDSVQGLRVMKPRAFVNTYLRG